jgi:hypothetical protein
LTSLLIVGQVSQASGIHAAVGLNLGPGIGRGDAAVVVRLVQRSLQNGQRSICGRPAAAQAFRVSLMGLSLAFARRSRGFVTR